ncbi:MAG TPA: type II toxin-antitoxin system RelE/ParE family toxin [Gammaproteobacteria bacterium]|nr:type II toxin-antitoxin system RelE/ParE family toxin [Gammaproteobacteria bacterium]
MYELSLAAAEDIETIFVESIARFGVQQTEVYVEDLQNCLLLLGEHPGMGRIADDIRTDYRAFPHQSHVIYYQEEADRIFVVRVLHKHMDAINTFQLFSGVGPSQAIDI